MSQTPGFIGITNPADTQALNNALTTGTGNPVQDAATQAAPHEEAGDNSKFESLLATLVGNFDRAIANNIQLQNIMTVYGTALKAAGKEPNPK